MKRRSIPTRFGTLVVTEDAGAITHLHWGQGSLHDDAGRVLDDAEAQLRAYDAGRLTQFTLPLRIGGSATLQAVCAEMSAIPFGDT